jgi:hypothetical protein
MKAVLEYTYPQDEAKLKHALRGEDYYLALVEIERIFMCEKLTQENSQVIVDILEKVLEE